MQAQARSRKRAADGSAQDATFPYSQQMQDGSFGVNDPLAQYRNPLANDTNTSFPDFPPYDNSINNTNPSANFYPPQVPTTQAPAYGQSVVHPSNQLVRRNTNQQVARTPQRNQWSNFANPTDRVWEDMDHEEEQDLDQKAAIAKKDAQAKRKQIPPFVQKLSSFLDSSNNTELIRWSDDGNSFIVLDEDEFARTLIPELFKHNNYASFVRQLNMYGFHKKVGLNANSMKAAEKKVKDPSVYWHEYFKRGRPDLLWLIQKPAAKSSSSKRKRDQEKRETGDSDDDHKNSPDTGDGGTGLMTTIPRQDMGTFRTELQKLQRQQSVISKMITSLKEQNEQFYRQATAFQALHDRHENSINAILTFLATFYNRSLDGHSGPPNLASFLNSASMPQQAQQQGSVFDMGDGDMNESNVSNTNNQQLQRYQKRPLLLPAPGPQNLSASPLSNTTPSVRSSTSPGPTQQGQHTTQYGTRPPQARPQQQQQQQPQRPSVTPVIKDDAPTPDLLNQYPEHDDVMNLIHNVNASNSPNNGGGAGNYDINSALDHLQAANSNSTLTPQQREDMLSMIAASGATGAGATAAQPGANNALMMPDPPTMPSLEALRQNNAQLDMLAKLQQEQDSKVADLAGRLQPLSPTGAIPGITANNFEDIGNPGDFDLSSYLNEPEDGYFGGLDTTSAAQQSTYPTTSAPSQGINDDLGFNWDYTQANGLPDTDDLFGDVGGTGVNDGSLNVDEGGGRVVGSVSSAGTSPPDTTKAAGDDEETPSKKRKTGE
ncbi:hypothetical protein KCU81_g1095, partial [Aureobasidium melanogenum]|uniref:HSF-type DNA-binding domain-containing protein n=1 Tax=Aureobasidium melanogenum (strain CBS 110374) TaxID=1043003 RepID=A0A074W0U7_AURM1